MTVREQTTGEAQPAAAPSAPTPSTVPVPLPDRSKDSDKQASKPPSDSKPDPETKPFPHPKLRLKIHDLNHPGASKFLHAVDPATVLSTALDRVLQLLYQPGLDEHTYIPPTRSVTLVLRDMGGVAYTTGSSLDNDHKEIHFSLRYIDSIQPPWRITAEIMGVLTHELAHCYQWDARGTCPGGLTEGVADWVRLNCKLIPPHWRRGTVGDWDSGYQHTAYFLEYLEGRYGEGTIRRLNQKLRQDKYRGESFWPELLGESVEKLYREYQDKERGEMMGARSE